MSGEVAQCTLLIILVFEGGLMIWAYKIHSYIRDSIFSGNHPQNVRLSAASHGSKTGQEK